jgi:hypothetical protein
MTSERLECGLCGGPVSRNPHPDAGKPSRILEVGAVWECIPCLVRARHSAFGRAQAAEQQVTALRDALGAALEHVEELEEAWRRGVLTEPPYEGGTRSNRNVKVRVAIRKALESDAAVPKGTA